MTFLSVFHKQDLELKYMARYGIDKEERMEVDNEPGNCISDNYNLFWLNVLVFIFSWRC